MFLIKRGILAMLLPIWRTMHHKHISILMLHGVMDRESAKTSWTPIRHQVSPRYLDNTLKLIRKKYKFISLVQAVDMLLGCKAIESNSMVITFDDGYRNNYTYALPILLKHMVPATIFLSTGQITRREPFWYDRIDYAIQHLRKDHTIQLESKTIRFSPRDPNSLVAAFRELRYAIKDIPENYTDTIERIDEIVEELEHNAGQKLSDIFEEDPWSSLLTWDDVKLATQKGVDFGSHTIDHVLLGKLEDDVVRQQLSVSKETIEKHTEKQCELLCYPSGNFSSRTGIIAAQCGYKSAVTTDIGLNLSGQVPMFALFRNPFPNSEKALSIFGGVSGLTGYLHKIF